MKLRFFGQNCFEIHFGDKILLMDPFITGNPLISDKLEELDINPDYILLTHAHGDHISDVVHFAEKSKAKIISTYEVTQYYAKLGYEIHPMNHGGKWEFDFGTLKIVNAVHSSTFPDNTPGGNPCGMVIWDESFCIYFAGDTALTMDMKLLPMISPKLNYAVLPIGDNFTMGYEDACIASSFIEADKIIGAHYDTFGYIEVDKAAAKDHFQKNGKDLILLDLNKLTELN